MRANNRGLGEEDASSRRADAGFGKRAAARPYLGLGLVSSAWHFGISPEFGVVIPTAAGEGRQAIVSMRYHYPMKTGEYIGGSKSFSYWPWDVGVFWERW